MIYEENNHPSSLLWGAHQYGRMRWQHRTTAYGKSADNIIGNGNNRSAYRNDTAYGGGRTDRERKRASEKELPSTVSKDQATKPTVTATASPTTAKPKEEIKPTEITKPPAAETTEPKNEEPPKEEEIYVGIQWPEVDPAEIERLIIEKINTYRIAQSETAATALPGLMGVARYRANELTTNFSHTDIRDVCKELKYGEFVDMTLYGMTAEDSYYQGYNREAIGMGEWFGTAESMSERIADGFHHSKGHWSYVGSSKYSYIAVGVTKANGKWYVCILMSDENYGEYMFK